jgi:hypothetical protein
MNKTADEKWLRYFCLASGLIAAIEMTSPVPNVPIDTKDIRAEMADIDSQCEISKSLTMWSTILLPQTSLLNESDFYVLDLHADKATIQVAGYPKELLEMAEKKCLELEKEADGNLKRQVVLVSVEQLNSLREAYPNYFVNALPFLAMLNK